MEDKKYASRAGLKLDFALTDFKKNFNVDVAGCTCADFGSSTGGFVDCLLQHGAKKVYAVDTGYGQLDWKLRTDPRVIVMERTNALHVDLPEKVDVLTIDAGWTKQESILPNALKNLKPTGKIITLIKPQYETYGQDFDSQQVLDATLQKLAELKTTYQFTLLSVIASPIAGERKKNIEYLALISV